MINRIVTIDFDSITNLKNNFENNFENDETCNFSNDFMLEKSSKRVFLTCFSNIFEFFENSNSKRINEISKFKLF